MMALAAECFVPQLGCEALFPVSGARVPLHHASPLVPTTPILTSSPNIKEFAATPKDYSIPLHVDCSVEYDLPDCAKPPQGVKSEPLLMIHPAHFRRLDSLRRCPFVNNLPTDSKNTFELPSSSNDTTFNVSSCQYPPNRTSKAPTARNYNRNINLVCNKKVKESPKYRNTQDITWTQLVNNQCCKNPLPAQPSQCNSSQISLQYKVADVPDPFWTGCGGGPSYQYAPKEGDTLENSSLFGKYPKYRSSRLRSHPYAASIEPTTPMMLNFNGNCDINLNSNFDILQGNLITTNAIPSTTNLMTTNNSNSAISSSPFHAKMFVSSCNNSAVYPNYAPSLVMYK